MSLQLLHKAKPSSITDKIVLITWSQIRLYCNIVLYVDIVIVIRVREWGKIGIIILLNLLIFQTVFDQSKGYVVHSLVNVSHRLTKLSTSLSQLLNTHNGRLENITHQLHCIQQVGHPGSFCFVFISVFSLPSCTSDWHYLLTCNSCYWIDGAIACVLSFISSLTYLLSGLRKHWKLSFQRKSQISWGYYFDTTTTQSCTKQGIGNEIPPC